MSDAVFNSSRSVDVRYFYSRVVCLSRSVIDYFSSTAAESSCGSVHTSEEEGVIASLTDVSAFSFPDTLVCDGTHTTVFLRFSNYIVRIRRFEIGGFQSRRSVQRIAI